MKGRVMLRNWIRVLGVSMAVLIGATAGCGFSRPESPEEFIILTGAQRTALYTAPDAGLSALHEAGYVPVAAGWWREGAINWIKYTPCAEGMSLQDCNEQIKPHSDKPFVVVHIRARANRETLDFEFTGGYEIVLPIPPGSHDDSRLFCRMDSPPPTLSSTPAPPASALAIDPSVVNRFELVGDTLGGLDYKNVSPHEHTAVLADSSTWTCILGIRSGF